MKKFLVIERIHPEQSSALYHKGSAVMAKE